MRYFCLYSAVAAVLASAEARAADTPTKIELDDDNYPKQALPVRTSFALTKTMPETVRRAAPVFVRFAYRMWSINPAKMPREYTTGSPIRPNDCAEVARALHRDRFKFKDLSKLPKGRVDVSDLWSEPPFPGAKATQIGQEHLLDYKIYRYLDWANSVYVPDVWTRDDSSKTFHVQVDDKAFFRPGGQYCMFFVTEADTTTDRRKAISTALRGAIADYVASAKSSRQERPDPFKNAVLLAAVADLETEEIRKSVADKDEVLKGCPKSDANTIRRCPAFTAALIAEIRVRHPLRDEKLKTIEGAVATVAGFALELAQETADLASAIGDELLSPPESLPGPWFLDLTDVTGVTCHGDAARNGGEAASVPAVPSKESEPKAEFDLRRRQAAELQCLLMSNQKTQVTFLPDAKSGRYSERHLWNNEVVAAVGISANLEEVWIQTAENKQSGTRPSAKLKTSDLVLSNGKTTLWELLRFHQRVRLGSDYVTSETAGPLAEYIDAGKIRGALATDATRLKALAEASETVAAMCKQYADLGARSCKRWTEVVRKGACYSGEKDEQQKKMELTRAECIAGNADALADRLPDWTEEIAKVDAVFVASKLDYPHRPVTIEAALRLDQETWVSSFITPVVGVAVIGGSRAFAIPYAAAQIYFWPNHVDEPMWTNGRLDLRRLVALEVGLGITRKDFGPDNRYSQLTDYNTPPFFYGLALQLLPYSTVSVGGALMKVRRSTFEREEPALFHTFYVGFNVELNFFNFVRSRFSRADFSSARTFALEGPPAPENKK